MKARELMQGNIILYEYEGQKIPARVVEIYRSSVLVESISGEYVPIEISEDKIFPVELTPEILEKNRFIRDGESWWYLDFRIVLFTSNGVSLVCGRQMRFRYVHQLQKALQLCGIEKEITI